MTIPRKYLINYSNTRYYHCVTRCVRKGYLLDLPLNDIERPNYRQQWIQDRLILLSEAFAIDVFAFSIMDNHTHLVLGANTKLSLEISDIEVLLRWKKIGKIPSYCEAFLLYKCIPESPIAEQLNERILEYRKRLSSISWFMKYFNEYIARRANKEEGMKGHFWESRFFSQALLDSKAVLNCMAYVDLNPIRAGKYRRLIDSRFTSIKKRLEDCPKSECSQYLLSSINTPEPYTKLPFMMSLKTYSAYLGVAANKYSRENGLISSESKLLISDYEKSPVFNFEKIYGTFAGKSSLVDEANRQLKIRRTLH